MTMMIRATCCRQDDLQATLSALFRSEYKSLTGKLMRITGSLEEAEDAAQTAFIRLLNAMPDAGEIRSAKAYLYRIAHNIAIDQVRRARLTKRIFHPEHISEQHEDLAHAATSPDILNGYDARQTMRKVLDSLDSLPTKCRQAFVMSKVEEGTYPEIATEMDLSVSMIEKYLSKALSHVRSTVPYEMAA